LIQLIQKGPLESLRLCSTSTARSFRRHFKSSGTLQQIVCFKLSGFKPVRLRAGASAGPAVQMVRDRCTHFVRASPRPLATPRHATKYSGQCMAAGNCLQKGARRRRRVPRGAARARLKCGAHQQQARFVALREPTLGASAHHPSRGRPCCGEPCRGVRSARHVVHSEQDTAETAVRPTSSARDGSAGHRSVSAPSVSNGGAEPHSSCVLLEYAGTAQPSRVGESLLVVHDNQPIRERAEHVLTCDAMGD
jgi:hypothetical protein